MVVIGVKANLIGYQRSRFFFEPAFIADPFVHLAPLVLASGDAVHFVAPVPERHAAAARGAVAVGVHRLQEPYAVLEAEGAVGQRAHRTDVNDVADEVVVQRLSI